MKKALLITLMMLLASVASFAHGGAKHAMATVKEVGKDSISVVTTDNQTQTVAINAKTKFTKSDQPAKVSDLKPGDRVVVEAETSGGKLVAESVRFGKVGTQNKRMDHNMSKMSH